MVAYATLQHVTRSSLSLTFVMYAQYNIIGDMCNQGICGWVIHINCCLVNSLCELPRHAVFQCVCVCVCVLRCVCPCLRAPPPILWRSGLCYLSALGRLLLFCCSCCCCCWRQPFWVGASGARSPFVVFVVVVVVVCFANY